jgi:hypothetical protein
MNVPRIELTETIIAAPQACTASPQIARANEHKWRTPEPADIFMRFAIDRFGRSQGEQIDPHPQPHFSGSLLLFHCHGFKQRRACAAR